MADAVVGAGAEVVGARFGEQAVDGGGGSPAQGAVGAVVVVELDEGVELALELAQRRGGASGGEPALQGLLESFGLAAGGGVVGTGVFLGDPETGEGGLELVAAAAAAGEAGRVDHGVVGQDRGGIAVEACGFAEGLGHGWAGDDPLRGDRQGVAGVIIEPGEGPRSQTRRPGPSA